MSTTLEEAPQENQTPAEFLQDAAERKGQLWIEAKKLLAEGDPWKALPKKAEAIGLKPLEGFYSMAAQDVLTRKDLVDRGTPLSSSPGAGGHFRAEAAAKLFPTPDGGEALLKSLHDAADQPPNHGTQTAIEQASEALHEIETKRRELQYQRAFDEVGLFTYNSGWLAARGGNGDLLVAHESPESRQALADAGYRDGREYGISLSVPFNNDEASRKDVNWVKGTGAEADPYNHNRR